MANKHQKFLKENRHHYDELFEKQGGVCAICGRPPKKVKLNLDHKHSEPMKIRGLLCVRCNRALPNWVTSLWLRKAAEYVEKTE